MNLYLGPTLLPLKPNRGGVEWGKRILSMQFVEI